MRRLFPNGEHYLPSSLCLVNSKLFLTNLAVNGGLIEIDLESGKHSKMLHSSALSIPHGLAAVNSKPTFQTSRVVRSNIFKSLLAPESQMFKCKLEMGIPLESMAWQTWLHLENHVPLLQRETLC